MDFLNKLNKKDYIIQINSETTYFQILVDGMKLSMEELKELHYDLAINVKSFQLVVIWQSIGNDYAGYNPTIDHSNFLLT